QHGGERAEQEEDEQREPGDVLVARAIAHEGGQDDPGSGRGREKSDESDAEGPAAKLGAQPHSPIATSPPRLALWPPHPNQARAPSSCGRRARRRPGLLPPRRPESTQL